MSEKIERSEIVRKGVEGLLPAIEWLVDLNKVEVLDVLKGMDEDDLSNLRLWLGEISGQISEALEWKRAMANVAANAPVEEGTVSAEELQVGEWVEVAGSPLAFLEGVAAEFASVIRTTKGLNGFSGLDQDKVREVLKREFNQFFGNGIRGQSVDEARSFYISLSDETGHRSRFDVGILSFELAINLQPINSQADGPPGYYSLPFVIKGVITEAGHDGAKVNGIEFEPNENYFKVSMKKLPSSQGKYSSVGRRYDELPRVDKGSLKGRLISKGKY